jgi:hypothetical protein
MLVDLVVVDGLYDTRSEDRPALRLIRGVVRVLRSGRIATASSVGTLLVLLAAACAGGIHDAAASDPPLLIPWSRVGDISLGERQARVEREYGSPGHGYHVQAHDGKLLQGYYVLHGHVVGVKFSGGRVERIDFSTRYYRTQGGFGVGSRIPLGPCVRTFTHTCGHRWHGFVWNEYDHDMPCGCWIKVGYGKRSLPPGPEPWTVIWVRHGRVAGFTLSTTYIG